MVVAVAQSAVSQLSAGVEGVGKGALVYISLGPQYAALGTFSAWFFVVFQAFRCFSSCVYGGCRSAIGSFAVVCRALKGWGKERWSVFL